jgi:hypothetical protein
MIDRNRKFSCKYPRLSVNTKHQRTNTNRLLMDTIIRVAQTNVWQINTLLPLLVFIVIIGFFS